MRQIENALTQSEILSAFECEKRVSLSQIFFEFNDSEWRYIIFWSLFQTKNEITLFLYL